MHHRRPVEDRRLPHVGKGEIPEEVGPDPASARPPRAARAAGLAKRLLLAVVAGAAIYATRFSDIIGFAVFVAVLAMRWPRGRDATGRTAA
jgi:hypothetical protein